MRLKTRIAITCVGLVAAAVVLRIVATDQRSLETITYSQLLERIQDGGVASAVVDSGSSGAAPVTCRLTDGTTVRSVLPPDYHDALLAMQEHRVNVEIRDASTAPSRLFLNAMPFLALLAVWIVLIGRRFWTGPGQGLLG